MRHLFESCPGGQPAPAFRERQPRVGRTGARTGGWGYLPWQGPLRPRVGPDEGTSMVAGSVRSASVRLAAAILLAVCWASRVPAAVNLVGEAVTRPDAG